ncbi:MAG: DUF167 domain-containing protein [Candidatus Dependentiae bacterium]|nr:DUF167 domain-containing protein [Candidatus Dependentiae bacterium]
MKITVKVIPRSGRQQLSVVGPSELRCHLTSAPEGGKANRELIELLAEVLRIPKRSVAVVQGFTSRNKVVEVVGFNDWQELELRLDGKD